MGHSWDKFASGCCRILYILTTSKAVESHFAGDDSQFKRSSANHKLSTNLMLHVSIQGNSKGPYYKDGSDHGQIVGPNLSSLCPRSIDSG